jgi:phage terminase large subunit
MKIDLRIPKAYKELLTEHHRYYCYYGGRGAARSWTCARYLIYRSLQSKVRIACFREFQRSIKESIHRLLSDQIELLGLTKYFEITDNSIVCLTNGSNFLFEGLHANVNKIKSLEGIDIADIEEAESVSEDSWQILLPTVRKENSQILIRFNTKYEDDPTYTRFVKSPPADCWTKLTSWEDNPYFPEVLKKEKDQDYAFRPHEAKNIWGGQPIGVGRLVWPDFKYDVHVKDFDWNIVKQTGNFFMAMDPASHYYPACIWLALFQKPGTKDLIKWIYAEYPTYNDLGDYFHKLRSKLLYTGSLQDLAREIQAKDGQEIKITKRMIDTRFAKGSGSASYVNDSQGIVSEMAKRENGGLIFTSPAEVTIDTMRSRITTDLQYNVLQPINSFNYPKLYVAPWCKNVIESLKNHRLQEQSETEDARYKDMSDAIRICYAGMDNHRYKSPGDQGQPRTSSMDKSFNWNNTNAGVGWMSA